MDKGTEIQNYLYDKTGQRTVPNIFISASLSLPPSPSRLLIFSPSPHSTHTDQKHVGGCDAVVALDGQGKLAGLVSA